MINVVIKHIIYLQNRNLNLIAKVKSFEALPLWVGISTFTDGLEGRKTENLYFGLGFVIIVSCMYKSKPVQNLLVLQHNSFGTITGHLLAVCS